MSTESVPSFAEVGPRLFENGYRPLPIKRGGKRPEPALGDWTQYQFKDADAEKYRHSGTGILCGECVGVDIDVRDAVLALWMRSRAEELLGPAPARIGAAPKVLLVYAVDGESFPKIQTAGYRLPADGPEEKPHKVEVLAAGQQFVAYAVHPETRRPYQWNGLGDPTCVALAMLPAVKHAQLKAFIAEAEAEFARRGRRVGRLTQAASDDREHMPGKNQRAEDPAMLRDALNHIPNIDLEWDDWVRVGYATKGALGDAGRGAWLAWSAKSAKDVPEFSARQWDSFKPATLGAGTIYFHAGQHGWQRPASSKKSPTPWPIPVNIFAELAASPYEASDVPPELSDYPAAYSAQTGIDLSITLVSAVVSAAAAIDDAIQVCADSSSNWFAQPRLWAVAIGAPGSGKTPGQREMLAPLRALHSELHHAWRAAVKALADDEPKPAQPRVVVNDTTLEALSDVLVDNPRGILVATDEFDAWLGSLDQYRSGGIGRDRGEWLRLFDGGPHSVERVKRGSLYVPNWAASLISATTPATMRRLSRHLPEDGLIQRFLIVLARRQELATTPPDRAEIEVHRARYVDSIRRLWDLTPRAHNGVVPLSFDTRQLFDSWRGENLRLQEAVSSLDPALEGHLAKYPTLALRLALVFHCAYVANFPDARARDPAAFPISAETMAQALRFLKRAGKHAFALYLGRKGGSDAYEIARAVARFLLSRQSEENAKGLARRDLLRRVHVFRDAEDGTQRTAMNLLVDLGWVREAEGGYLKAAPTRYAVNPRAAELFAVMADRERERRALVRERIAESSAERREDGRND